MEDVLLMKETVGEQVQIKATEGIRAYQMAKVMTEVGTTRICTSSSLLILQEFDELYHFDE